MFKGSYTVMVTPFRADGGLDERTLRNFVDWQIEQGTQGLIPLGSTGEFLSQTREERRQVAAIVVEQAKKRVPGDRRHCRGVDEGSGGFQPRSRRDRRRRRDGGAAFLQLSDP